MMTSRFLIAALLAVTLQQILVSIGTYLIGLMAKEIATGNINFMYAVGIIAATILPGSFFHYIITYLSTKAIKQSQYDYVIEYSMQNFNHPEHWRVEKSKSARHNLMIRSAHDAITEGVHAAVDFASTSINVIANSVSIFYLTNGYMTSSIFIGGIAGLAIVAMAGKSIMRSTDEALKSDSEVSGVLAKSWDNVILGNQRFFQNWLKKFKTTFGNNTKSNIAVVKIRDFWTSVAAVVTTGIVSGTAIGLLFFHQANKALLVGLIVMLPRSLQCASHLQILQMYFAYWKSIRQKFSMIESSYADFDSVDVRDYIHDDRIRVTKMDSIELSMTLESFISELPHLTSGRFRIQGENGCGKSSLLIHIKKVLGESALFIPAQHTLEHKNLSMSNSSGENALHLLKDTTANLKGALLLDEWDANLSSKNREIMDSEIQSLANHQLVVEVVHQRS